MGKSQISSSPFSKFLIRHQKLPSSWYLLMRHMLKLMILQGISHDLPLRQMTSWGYFLVWCLGTPQLGSCTFMQLFYGCCYKKLHFSTPGRLMLPFISKGMLLWPDPQILDMPLCWEQWGTPTQSQGRETWNWEGQWQHRIDGFKTPEI